MMEQAMLKIVKSFFFLFSFVGIIYHLITLSSPESGKKLEQKLATEFGMRKAVIPWLEKQRMHLHNFLIENKTYNILALIFFITLLISLLRT